MEKVGNLCEQTAALEKSARGRNRTADTRIFSPLLYRLSYPRIENMFPMPWGKCENYHKQPQPVNG